MTGKSNVAALDLQYFLARSSVTQLIEYYLSVKHLLEEYLKASRYY